MDDKVQRFIEQARAQGVPDQEIQSFLAQQGVQMQSPQIDDIPEQAVQRVSQDPSFMERIAQAEPFGIRPIPTATSILGGIAGGTVGGLVSSPTIVGIPAGVIAGAAAGGAAGGAGGEAFRQRFIPEEERDARLIAEEAAFGAGGELIGPGFRVGKGLLKPAGKAALKKTTGEVGERIIRQTAKEAVEQGASRSFGAGLEKTGQAARRGVLNLKTPPTPYFRENERVIMSALDELGFSGSATRQAERLAPTMKALDTQIDQFLRVNPSSISKAQFKEQLTKSALENTHFNQFDPTAMRHLNAAIDDALVGIKGNEITNAQIFQVKNSLANGLGNAFRKASGDLASDMSAKEAARYSAWSSVDEILTSMNPEVKQATLTQSFLHQASPAIQKATQASGKTPVIGRVPGVSTIEQEMMDATGRMLIGAGKGTQALEALPALRAIQQAAPRSVFGTRTERIEREQITPEIASVIQELQSGQDADADMSEQLSPDGMWQWTGSQWIPTEDQFQALAMQDLQQTGGKNLSRIETARKMFSQEAKLTENQKKQLANYDKAIDFVEVLADELVNNIGVAAPGRQLEARISGNLRSAGAAFGLGEEDLSSFNKVRTGMRVQMARAMGEVGNLSEPEQKAALALLPDVGMTEREIQENVRLLKRLIERGKQRTLQEAGGTVSAFSQLEQAVAEGSLGY